MDKSKSNLSLFFTFYSFFVLTYPFLNTIRVVIDCCLLKWELFAYFQTQQAFLAFRWLWWVQIQGIYSKPLCTRRGLEKLATAKINRSQ